MRSVALLTLLLALLVIAYIVATVGPQLMRMM